MPEVTGYDLPRTQYRIVYDAGFGWPNCTRRERTRRTYATAEQVARQLAVIAALPSHHKLVGVWVARSVNWEPIDPADLLPEGNDDDNEPDDNRNRSQHE